MNRNRTEIRTKWLTPENDLNHNSDRARPAKPLIPSPDWTVGVISESFLWISIKLSEWIAVGTRKTGSDFLDLSGK